MIRLKMGKEIDKPDISVIIPMYNAENTVRECLRSIFASQGVRFEVIVVNDASTDDSLSMALQFPCKIISFKSNSMISNCRNIGAHYSESDILLFFDADQIMKTNTLQRFVQVFRDCPDVQAVVASYEMDTPAEGFFSKFKNIRHHYVHQNADKEGWTLAGGFSSIRKSKFEEMGGFKGLYLEDIIMGYKLHRKHNRILFCKNIQVVHLKKYSLRTLLISDVFHRSIPWMQIMLRERIWKNDLNTGMSNIISVVLAMLILPLCIPLGIKFGAIAAIIIVSASWIMNRGLLRLAFSHFRFLFLLKSLIFILFMYFYEGIGAIIGIISYYLGYSIIDKQMPAVCSHEVLQYGRII
ncbi:MAG: glycosyltransferase family 2 protein [Candidatus Aminicenantes bacterium]|nr:glycosyltransferase family 2 protein [Candidatus Aminicenantes bacterium]